MAIRDCINKIRESGIEITNRQAKLIQDEADRLENMYRSKGEIPEGEIRAKAELDAANQLVTKIKQQRHAESIRIQKSVEGLSKITERAKSGIGGHQALRDFLVPRDIVGGDLPIESIANGLYGRATAGLGEFVEEFRSKIPGGIDTFFRSRSDRIKEVVDALHGHKDVSEVASKFAKVYDDAREFLLKDLEENGLAVKRLEDFGISHKWDYYRVSSMSKDDFVKAVSPHLDRAKMFDEEGNLLTEEGIDKLLRASYEDILDKEVVGGLGRARLGGTANLRAASRKLHFTSDGFTKVHELIGQGDLFDNMMDSLQELAADAAFVRKLGPSPDATFKELLKVAERLEREFPSKFSAAAKLASNEKIYNYLRGAQTGLGNPNVAAASSTIRNFTSAARLSAATLSALTDQAFLRSNAQLWGMGYNRILGKEVLRVLGIGGKRDRELAARNAQILDWSFTNAQALSRYSDTSVNGKVSAVAAGTADFVIRTSGLNALTLQAKQVFALELNSYLFKHSKLAFDALPDKIRNALRVNKIEAADWEEMRKHTVNLEGMDWMSPESMPKEIAIKWAAMISNETRHAVPEPGAEVRAMITGGAAAGSVEREARNLFFQFKTFGLTTALNTTRRALLHPSNQGIMNKTKYAANLALMGSILGAISLQLKEVSKGKEPRDPSDPMFIAEAISQSGTFGLGYMVDPVIALSKGETSKYDLVRANTPPAVAMAIDLGAGVSSSIYKTIEGKPGAAAPLTKAALRNLPLGTWYTNLMQERLIEDQLIKWVDPQAQKHFYDQERRLRKEEDRDYWWAPGSTSPDL